jgi:hypothetical protein
MRVQSTWITIGTQLSGTTIRGTQIEIENHPATPFKGNGTQKGNGPNLPLMGLQQGITTNQLKA